MTHSEAAIMALFYILALVSGYMVGRGRKRTACYFCNRPGDNTVRITVGLAGAEVKSCSAHVRDASDLCRGRAERMLSEISGNRAQGQAETVP
jgi:hypothetical protein